VAELIVRRIYRLAVESGTTIEGMSNKKLLNKEKCRGDECDKKTLKLYF
jgi:hypothetical protein